MNIQIPQILNLSVHTYTKSSSNKPLTLELVRLAQVTNHVISVEYFRFLAPLITSVTKFPERSSAKK
jgi:hypothetical protein